MKPAINQAAQQRAVAYARYSSELQRGESITAQLDAIREYAAQSGILIVNEYIDEAFSAKTDARPSFQRMVDDSKARSFDLVLVHKLDRFARNREDAAMYRMILKKNDVRLFSVMERLDGSPESIILEAVLEGMAEYYTKNLAREVMKGLTQNAKAGKSTGGPPPLGFKVNKDTKKLEIHEEEAEAVRMIFRMVLEGYSYRDVIDALNDHGHKTRSGRRFTQNSLYAILRNVKYRGCFEYNRTAAPVFDAERGRYTTNRHKYKPDTEIIRVEDGCPKIVSNDDFYAVQRLMDARQQPRSNAQYKYKERYLLTGKIYCGLCGGAYVGSRRKTDKYGSMWIYYACNQRCNSKGHRCQSKEIKRDYIESVIISRIQEAAFSDAMIPMLTREYNAFLKASDGGRTELTKKRRRRTKLEGDIEHACDIALQTNSPKMLERLAAMEDEKRILDREIAELERLTYAESVNKEEIARTLGIIRTKMSDGTLENLKQIINVFVKRIEVFPDNISIQINYLPNIKIPVASAAGALARKKKDRPDDSDPDGRLSHNNPNSMDHFGRGRRTRTLKNGFGDRHVTITSYPYWCGLYWTRTSDPIDVNDVLYQLSQQTTCDYYSGNMPRMQAQMRIDHSTRALYSSRVRLII